jgi:hypothetical protein
MTNADPRLADRLRTGADHVTFDVEERLAATHRRGSALQLRRRVLAGAAATFIALVGLVSVWRFVSNEGHVPASPPDLSGAIVYVAGYGRSDTPEIAVWSPDGGSTGTLSIPWGALSPDGRRFASWIENGKLLEDGYGLSDLHVDGFTDGRDEVLLRDIAAAGPPDWGPSGEIAYWSYAEPIDVAYELFVREEDGTIRGPILTMEGQLHGADWSPDGSSFGIAVGTETGIDGFDQVHGWSVAVVAADGSAVRAVVPTTGNPSSVAWSPDGSRLAFHTDDQGTPTSEGADIWVVDADGANLRRLTSVDTVDRDPVWSPDGEWIAFSSRPLITEILGRPIGSPTAKEAERIAAATSLFVVRPDGSGLRRLAGPGGVLTPWAWLEEEPTR